MGRLKLRIVKKPEWHSELYVMNVYFTSGNVSISFVLSAIIGRKFYKSDCRLI